jgi:ABC-type polysaccharide transport system permease subunit
LKTIRTWKSESDEGIYYAMNKAVQLCKGEHISFLNAEDYFVNLKVLSKIVKELEKYKPNVLVSQNIRIEN